VVGPKNRPDQRPMTVSYAPPQEAQLPPEHEPQELPPPRDIDSPSELRAKAATADGTRRAPLLQWGQDADSSARLMGLISSNLTWQLEQRNSYTGIVKPQLPL